MGGLGGKLGVLKRNLSRAYSEGGIFGFNVSASSVAGSRELSQMNGH